LKPLATPVELERAEAAFHRAYANAGSTTPFRDALSARLLLYPIDYTLLDRHQFESLADAARASDATSAYLAGFGGEAAGWPGTYGHCIADLTSYDEYRNANPVYPLEHFLYAPSGAWGLVTFHGEYALVAGSDRFIADLARRLEYDETRAVNAFVRDWRAAGEAGASTEWAVPLLDHVLGRGVGDPAWRGARGSRRGPCCCPLHNDAI
jgi:hypothetical protein